MGHEERQSGAILDHIANAESEQVAKLAPAIREAIIEYKENVETTKTTL